MASGNKKVASFKNGNILEMFGGNPGQATKVGGESDSKKGKKRALEEDHDPQAGERPVAKDGEGASLEGQSKGESVENGVLKWLNDLTPEQCKALFNGVISDKGAKITKMVRSQPAEEIEGLAELKSGINSRDGSWYLSLIRCHISGLSAADGHPRVQVDVLSKGETQNGLLSRVKAAVGKEASDRFIRLGDSLGSGKPGRKQIKLQAHHVAFRAASEDGVNIVPLNAGKGGSISHLCDVKGCVRGDHLESTPAHAQNMARQRCHGVRLLTFANQIVQETPCAHGRGKGDTLGEILASCRKVSILEVSAGAADIIQNAAFESLE